MLSEAEITEFIQLSTRGSSMESLRVRQYMIAQPIVFHPHQPLAQVAKELVEKEQIGAPVCDEHHHVVGWISEQDCLGKMLEDTYYRESITLIDDVMRTDVLSIDPEMSIFELAQMVLGPKPKMYPVVEEGRLIGIITRREILRAINHQLEACFQKGVRG